MVDALLTDRAEQQALEAAQTARADDEQIGILRLLHKHMGRLAEDGTRLAVDSGLQARRLLEGLRGDITCAILP